MIKILNETVFDDLATVVEIYGQGCNYPTKNGVEGYQVDFDVEATNSEGETEQFHIVFQSTDRTDNMRSYCGYEMSRANAYGCDADESGEMEKFMDYQEGIFDDLQERAEDLCEKWLDANVD